MLECSSLSTGEKKIVLFFRREDLLYDIRNAAFIEGELMGDDQMHERHVVQDVGEGGNVDRVIRILDLTHSECVEMLYPFTKREIIHDCLDDRFTDKKLYSIFMKVPEDFSQTTLNSLEKLVHEFLVSTAMADWLSITNPQKSQIWQMKAEELKAAIQSKRHLRRGVIRRRLHPF